MNPETTPANGGEQYKKIVLELQHLTYLFDDLPAHIDHLDADRKERLIDDIAEIAPSSVEWDFIRREEIFDKIRELYLLYVARKAAASGERTNPETGEPERYISGKWQTLEDATRYLGKMQRFSQEKTRRIIEEFKARQEDPSQQNPEDNEDNSTNNH